jgi:aldehyde dehydrogenase
MIYTEPNSTGAKFSFQDSYMNYINGKWTAPRAEKFFDVVSPVNGKVYTKVARSDVQDVELALDAAHAAAPAWAKISVTERSQLLYKIADRIEQNLEKLALAETWGNGKPIRETLAADVPLAVDHFRYFASVIRADEGSMAELDQNTVSYHLREPLGVVAQIIPWNFPLLMAAWKIAPALAAGNCIVLKPAEQTPVTALLLAELVGDILPKGVLNVINGFGLEAGKPLASSNRIAKVAFTGETGTGRLIMQYAAENLIPVTLELGGKSPNIFMEDIFDQDDAFVQKALEGFSMFAFNQGEVCTCPSRALIHEKIYSRFMEMALARVQKIKVGNPLDTDTMVGAVASTDQHEKILSYIQVGKAEGANLLTGGAAVKVPGVENGYYVQPTVFEGNNKMKIFQEEIFGPVLSVAKFKNKDEAISIANDSAYGLGAGLWTRQVHNAYEMARQIKAGRVWTNCYHLYPAHAAFGGYKQSGIGRETHKMMLSHYTQTKNILISYDKNPMGFF